MVGNLWSLALKSVGCSIAPQARIKARKKTRAKESVLMCPDVDTKFKNGMAMNSLSVP